MNKNTLKIEKIKELPLCSAQHCFGVFLILLFFAIVCGVFLFYKYNIIPENQKIENLDAPLKFNEERYQEILQIWKSHEQKIEQSESKQYPSLFRKEPEPEPEPEEETESEPVEETESEPVEETESID